MAAIHVLLPDRSQKVFEDFEVLDLIREGELTPEQFFWKEGMPEWRPLTELSSGTKEFIPERRKTGSLPRWPGVVTNFQISTVATSTGTGALVIPVSKSANEKEDRPFARERHRLRYWCEPSAAIAQALLVTAMGIAGMNLWLDWSFFSGVDFLDGNAYFAAKKMLLLSQLGAGVVAQVGFFFWLYFTSSNTRRLTPEIKYTPGMAIAYFFIPLLNFLRPYQVMQEIWKVSRDPRGWYNQNESVLVILWWGFYLLFWMLVRGDFILVEKAVDHDNFQETMIVLQAIDVTTLLNLGTTALLVTLITWRHKKLSRGN